jgi:hypothetical protein
MLNHEGMGRVGGIMRIGNSGKRLLIFRMSCDTGGGLRDQYDGIF